MAAFDFKKEFPEFYLPARTPHLIEIPELPYLAVAAMATPTPRAASTRPPWACSMPWLTR